MLATCQPGYEPYLVAELTAAGAARRAQGAGWALFDTGEGRPAFKKAAGDWAFPHLVMLEPAEVRAASVNALAQKLVGFFAESLRGECIATAWPCMWLAAGGTIGLSRRTTAVARSFQALLERKLPRVAALATAESASGAGPARGLFVLFGDFDWAWTTRDAVVGGQRRMADDPTAPSRSFLKVEEAFHVLGAAPRPGESVVDLGAAPGGWSYGAARRGARVIAIDNGPLRGGAFGHLQIEHRREDAFCFHPAKGERFDWLLCDLVEEPHHVLRNLVSPWLSQGWCRRFVVNLKFGRTDPVMLLHELHAPSSPFMAHAATFRVRHLYHDRAEFTVVGKLAI